MAFNFSGGTVNVSGNVEMENTLSGYTTRYNFATSGTTEYTVPAGKKWYVIGAGATYTGGLSSVAYKEGSNSNYIAISPTDSTYPQNITCNLIVVAGLKVAITRTGYFTYLEVDA